MKHKLTILISVLIIIAVAAGSAIKYEHNHHWQDVQNAKARASAWAEAQNAKREAVKHAAQVDELKAQCSKDHQLFVASRGKSVNGDCDPSLLLVQ